MRPHRSTILITLIALLLVAFVAVMAQTPQTGEQKKPAGEAMESCCKGDSCPMKKGDGAAKAEDGKSCCDNCDCCKGKTDSAT